MSFAVMAPSRSVSSGWVAALLGSVVARRRRNSMRRGLLNTSAKRATESAGMRRDVSTNLGSLCTIGVGGPARAFWTAESAADVREALAEAPDAFVLGGGSNV